MLQPREAMNKAKRSFSGSDVEVWQARVSLSGCAVAKTVRKGSRLGGNKAMNSCDAWSVIAIRSDRALT